MVSAARWFPNYPGPARHLESAYSAIDSRGSANPGQKRRAEANAMRVLLPRGYSGGLPGSNSAGHLLAPGPWALRCPWWWTGPDTQPARPWSLLRPDHHLHPGAAWVSTTTIPVDSG